jgi:O-antigen ligase
VTTALQRRTDQDGPVPGLKAPPPRRRSWFAREPGWPLVALLVGWPLWWALGLAQYIFVLLAFPMAYRMYLWKARDGRAIRLPPGFGLWLLYLVIMFAGVTMLRQDAPGTLPGGIPSHMVASWALRAILYLSATVVLLFTGNLTESEMPRKRLAWMLGLVAIYALVFGLAAVADPSFHFTSPLAKLVPNAIQQADVSISAALHPALTQKQTFGGVGRPAAPFTFSNGWGNNLAITLPWLIVGWWVLGTPRQRKICGVILAIAIVPIVFSFDRGLWIGLVLAAGYMAVRLSAKHPKLLAGFIGAVLVVAVVVALSPLMGLITARIHKGSSNAGRANQAVIALEGAKTSPILGYGDTRREQGGSNSIAVGKSANCPSCGNNSVGSHGQLWYLLFANGPIGAFFYFAFFGYGIWQFRRDRTPYGYAGILVLLLSFVFSTVYLAVGPPLIFMMLSYALLWRNDAYRREELAASVPDGPAPGVGNRRDRPPAGVPA